MSEYLAPTRDNPAHRLLSDGPLLSIVDAAAAIGVRISSRTGLRWAIHGTRGARLASVRVGGRRLTTAAALRRFIAEQQERDATPAEAALSVSAADAVLAAHALPRGGRR